MYNHLTQRDCYLPVFKIYTELHVFERNFTIKSIVSSQKMWVVTFINQKPEVLQALFAFRMNTN